MKSGAIYCLLDIGEKRCHAVDRWSETKVGSPLLQDPFWMVGGRMYWGWIRKDNVLSHWTFLLGHLDFGLKMTNFAFQYA